MIQKEDKEMKSPRTNSTFGFCRHTGEPEKTKRAIFCQRTILKTEFKQ